MAAELRYDDDAIWKDFVGLFIEAVGRAGGTVETMVNCALRVDFPWLTVDVPEIERILEPDAEWHGTIQAYGLDGGAKLLSTAFWGNLRSYQDGAGSFGSDY